MGGREGVLALCRAMVRAYAGLHEREVIHGDVHSRNALVAADGSVRLIDFGIARWDGAPEDLAPVWNAWEAPDEGGSLCCGLAGRAYALLNLYRHGGGREWLDRARDLANRAAVDFERSPEHKTSLYKGEIGIAVLAADLVRPETAAMPFFEDEGWT